MNIVLIIFSKNFFIFLSNFLLIFIDVVISLISIENFEIYFCNLFGDDFSYRLTWKIIMTFLFVIILYLIFYTLV